MQINRSDNPDFALIRKWLRRLLVESSEYRVWIYGEIVHNIIRQK